MARVLKQIEVCDRCALGREKPASETRRFSLDGNRYKLKLCDEHAKMFDRELMGWVRLAQDDGEESVAFGAKYRERSRRAAQLRAQQVGLQPAKETALPIPQPLVSHRTHRLGLPVHTEEVKPGERYSNGWMLTPHASERADQRGYGLEAVLAAADRPAISYDAMRHSRLQRIHLKDECAVVVDPLEKVVITVLHRDEAKYALDHHRHLAERIAR